MVSKWLRFWILVFGTLLALLVFAEVADDVFQGPREGDHEVQSFDQAIFSWSSQFRTPIVTQAMTDLTALGSVSVVITLFVILASVLASYRDFRGLSYITAVLAGAGVWPTLLKIYYRRPRPVELEHLVTVTDFSFPSGHAFGAAAVYIALAFYSAHYAKSWAQELFFYILGGALILLVGVTRIYLGVHYPTDVVAGIAAGSAWGFGVSAVVEYFKAKKRA